MGVFSPNYKFSGNKQTPADLLQTYKIIATPTLLFLKGDGSEIVKRITGYQGSYFFWDYLDKAVENANNLLQ